jgi:uncharacterized membrane protein
MDQATRLDGYDPYFDGAEVGPAKEVAPRAQDSDRRRRQFRIRSMMLVVALVAVWLWILRDPLLGQLVVGVVMWVASILLLVGMTMGLGLLGFGLCTVGDRIIHWLRRGSTWPDS